MSPVSHSDKNWNPSAVFNNLVMKELLYDSVTVNRQGNNLGTFTLTIYDDTNNFISDLLLFFVVFLVLVQLLVFLG